MLPVLRRGSWLNSAFDEPFSRLRNEADVLFDRFFGSDGGSLGQVWQGVPVAMWEDDEHVYIEADLPGVADKDLEVTAHNGMLFIRGERKLEEGRSYLYNGRSHGRFERILALPASVTAEQVEAKLANGVLSVVLHKTPEAKPRKIEVKGS